MMVRSWFTCRKCKQRTNTDSTNPADAKRMKSHMCRACQLKHDIEAFRKWLFEYDDYEDLNAGNLKKEFDNWFGAP